MMFVHRAGTADDGDDRPGARRHVAAQRLRPHQPALLLPERQVSRRDVGPGRRYVTSEIC